MADLMRWTQISCGPRYADARLDAPFYLTGSELSNASHMLKDSGVPLLMYAQLLSFHEAGFLMSASVGAADAGEVAAAEAMGLLTEHAYSLLRAIDVHVPTTGRAARLVQLRNPWGKLEWRGDWSDSSNLWTPELRALLHDSHGSDGDDGVFWMSFEVSACTHTPNGPVSANGADASKL